MNDRHSIADAGVEPHPTKGGMVGDGGWIFLVVQC